MYSEINFKNGKLHEKSLEYSNGNITLEREYRDGKAHGVWKNFYSFGNLGLESIVNYVNGEKMVLGFHTTKALS